MYLLTVVAVLVFASVGVAHHRGAGAQNLFAKCDEELPNSTQLPVHPFLNGSVAIVHMPRFKCTAVEQEASHNLNEFIDACGCNAAAGEGYSTATRSCRVSAHTSDKENFLCLVGPAPGWDYVGCAALGSRIRGLSVSNTRSGRVQSTASIASTSTMVSHVQNP